MGWKLIENKEEKCEVIGMGRNPDDRDELRLKIPASVYVDADAVHQLVNEDLGVTMDITLTQVDQSYDGPSSLVARTRR